MNLSDQTVLITGAAGRIGSAAANLCLEYGASLVLVDISKERLESFVNQMPADLQNKVSTIVCDLTSEQQLNQLFLKINESPFLITSAVHSAYPTSSGWGTSFEDLTPKNLASDLCSQLGGAILFSQKMMNYFQENSAGNLIHISSIQGISAPKFEHYHGTNMSSPIEYSAIKAGVIAITRWLSKYYSNQNIRVNCVSPGGILDNQPESFLQAYRESCTNIGMLSSKQVAECICFLLSSSSAAINGQNIIVDDGWSL
ncbi:oxidoreductase [Synechococcus sp. RS9916]|uniref:oxidoreductase n=1 Tax=Synechococcus sp. RS9916 TaxID=221359 RepID=UPI0000E537B8|nr:oxidoreductase [Synechococcus sp. RS9916]EAU75545.1 Short-chain dehydrogenase/reductase SDR [Synechococcus sp. RS9916]